MKEPGPGATATARSALRHGPAVARPRRRVGTLQAELDEFAGRRTLLLGALGLLAVVIGAGSYSVARAYARELAVMRLQSDFVSAVSHEFRTPLTSLRQLSETLNEGRPLDDERRAKYYQALDRATNRLQKLVEGLLDFGRMESGAMVYRKQDLDAAALVTVGGGRVSARGRRPGLSRRAEGRRRPLLHSRRSRSAEPRDLEPAGQRGEVLSRVQDDTGGRRAGRNAGLPSSVEDRGLGIPAVEQWEDPAQVRPRHGGPEHRHQGHRHRAGDGEAYRRCPRRLAPPGERARKGQHPQRPAAGKGCDRWLESWSSKTTATSRCS